MSQGRTCPTPGCGRPSLPDRRACACCHKRAYRQAHPVRDTLHRLRSHAKERGIPCDLSPWEWEQFCAQTGYIERRGPFADDLTVDRHDAEEGYHAANINILPRRENATKWNTVDRPRRFSGAYRRPAA